MAAAAAAVAADAPQQDVHINIKTVGVLPAKKLGAPRKYGATVGAFTRFMQMKGFAPMVPASLFLFVTMPASQGASSTNFIPSPDQTLGELATKYGEVTSDGKLTLTVTFSEKVYFG